MKFICKLILLFLLPVLTLSPIFNSFIITVFPFSVTTVAVDGKQSPSPGKSATKNVGKFLVVLGMPLIYTDFQ